MLGGRRRVFAGRGIALPPLRITALVLAGGLVAGFGAGWMTKAIVTEIRRAELPQATAAIATDLEAPEEIPVPSLEPITRQLTESDARAGVTTVEVPLTGEGTFTMVPGVGQQDPLAGDVRWVSIGIEDGITADPAALSEFILDTLNDERAWGTADTYQYLPTDGVADFRILLATPATALKLCASGNTVDPSSDASDLADEATALPTVSADAATTNTSGCGEGDVVISMYDWVAGADAFGRDFESARIYRLLHGLGQAMGKDVTACVPPRADVMVDQSVVLPEGCAANPWPYPDAIAAGDPSPTPSP